MFRLWSKFQYKTTFITFHWNQIYVISESVYSSMRRTSGSISIVKNIVQNYLMH